MMEKSASYVFDNLIRAFRVPTSDVNGKVKYYDVTVELSVNADGTLSPVAEVSSTRSPKSTTGVIPPGTYKSLDSVPTTCVVTNMTLLSGRIQSFFSCSRSTSTFDLSIATGSVSDGHPFVNPLLYAKIDTLADVGTYTWGLQTNGVVRIGDCSGFIAQDPPIGAKTDGNLLVLSFFGSNGSPDRTAAEYICSGTLKRQP